MWCWPEQAGQVSGYHLYSGDHLDPAAWGQTRVGSGRIEHDIQLAHPILMLYGEFTGLSQLQGKNN